MRGNIMMKTTALALACLLAVGGTLLPETAALCPTLTAAAADSVEGTADGLTYLKYDDHIEITGYDDHSPDVTIPAHIDGLPVTRIGKNAFEYSTITSVTLPDSLTEIGQWSFASCYDLTAVDIPGTVPVIEMDAFAECTALTDVTLHEGLIELRQGVFSNTGIEKIVLPETLERLRAGSFSNSLHLKEVVFPHHLVDIYSGVFSDTPWLFAMREKDPLVIVDGTLIDGYACKGDVVIPDDVTIVASGAFSTNMGIKSVVIPASVKNIWDRTFYYCLHLEKVEIQGTRYIGPDAFGGCDEITDVKIGGALTEVGEDAFDSINKRLIWQFGGTEAQYKAITVGTNNKLFKVGIPKYGVLGDVDWNGNVEVADVIAMQKWLLKVPGTRLSNVTMSDMNSDGVVDVLDCALLKRALTKK